MVSTTDVVPMLRERIVGARIVDVLAATGNNPGYTLLLENDKEEHGTFTIQAGLETVVQAAGIKVTPQILTSGTEFKK